MMDTALSRRIGSIHRVINIALETEEIIDLYEQCGRFESFNRLPFATQNRILWLESQKEILISE